MSQCMKCRYALINDRCPICGGRQIKGVGPLEKSAPVRPLNNIAEPLKMYWSPKALSETGAA